MFLKREYTQWGDLLAGLFIFAVMAILIWLFMEAI